MITKLAQGLALARQATQVASTRGHRLGAWLWRTYDNGGRVGNAFCQHCSQEATVCTNPAPNGIAISGEAVALNCVDEDRQYD